MDGRDGHLEDVVARVGQNLDLGAHPGLQALGRRIQRHVRPVDLQPRVQPPVLPVGHDRDLRDLARQPVFLERVDGYVGGGAQRRLLDDRLVQLHIDVHLREVGQLDEHLLVPDARSDLHGGRLAEAAVAGLVHDHAGLRGPDRGLLELVLEFLEASLLQGQGRLLRVAVGRVAVQFALGPGVDAVVFALELEPIGVRLLGGLGELVPQEQVQGRPGLVQKDLVTFGGQFIGLQFAARHVPEFFEFAGPLDLAGGAFEFLVGQVDVGLEFAFLLEGLAAQGGVGHERLEVHLALARDEPIGQFGAQVLLEVEQAELDVERRHGQQALAGALLDEDRLVGLVEGRLGGLVDHLLSPDGLLEVGRIEFDQFVAFLDEVSLLDDPEDGALTLDLAADVDGPFGVDLAALGNRNDEPVAGGPGRFAGRRRFGAPAAQQCPHPDDADRQNGRAPRGGQQQPPPPRRRRPRGCRASARHR